MPQCHTPGRFRGRTWHQASKKRPGKCMSSSLNSHYAVAQRAHRRMHTHCGNPVYQVFACILLQSHPLMHTKRKAIRCAEYDKSHPVL